jgi:alcohol dehydrogenase
VTTLTGFDLPARTRLVFGVGAVDRLGGLARELGGTTVLLVTDPGIAAAGHAARAARSLEAEGLRVVLYDRSKENPSALDVQDCVAVARASKIDLIVGLGGGSSLDTAKGCNFILTNGGRMQDYWGTGKASKPLLPLIAVPTTAGTGSECQSYALIADEKTHQKMACGDPKAAARVAVLDPALTVSQPRKVTAMTGLDAISHAVETAVTRRRNEASWLYTRESFRLTSKHLERVLAKPDDLEARAGMQLGAAYGGLAIELSMLGAAHSAANPLTANYGVVHGHAVSLMLPHVVRFNAEDPAAREAYAELAGSAAALASRLEELLRIAELPSRLDACGVRPDSIVPLSAEAATQWTAQFNPRPVSSADFEGLYRAAMNGKKGSA